MANGASQNSVVGGLGLRFYAIYLKDGTQSCGMDIFAQVLQRATEDLVQAGWGSTREPVDLLVKVFPEEDRPYNCVSKICFKFTVVR